MTRRRSDNPLVVGTGLAVLDRIYADGDFAGEALGGSCANVLVSLAMLRRQVLPVLSLGADETGDKLLREFRRSGADIRHINRRADIRSPVIAQELHTASASHSFSFMCLETSVEFPRYQSIERDDVEAAAALIASCAVFYTDRASEATVLAMESARSSGALVFFEPSEITDYRLFEQAVSFASVVKYSSDRLDPDSDRQIADSGAVSVITHGAAGLEIRRGRERRWCDAVPAETVADTCGSGDMVSVGLIDWLLARTGPTAKKLSLEDVIAGVIAGQRLAAANCAYAGARGLFHRRGAAHARRILSGRRP